MIKIHNENVRGKKRRGTTSVELILLMPLTIVMILIFFWLTRVYSAKHTAWTESSVSTLAKAQEINHTGRQNQTLPIRSLQQTDLAHFLSQWPSRKNVQRGMVVGQGEEDTGDGVEAGSEGLGVIESEDWLVADTWKDAFVFPNSRRQQPMLTLPRSVQAIVPRSLPRLNTTAFTRLTAF
jgi:hypothetical protein